MPFFTESWFWRGTQSAIFYYVSLTPCLEYKHKQRRRKEATRAQKERQEIISTQPGIIRQPAPFQTNEDWAEEIIAGPGPPKGWKKDDIFDKFTKRYGAKAAEGDVTRKQKLAQERLNELDRALANQEMSELSSPIHKTADQVDGNADDSPSSVSPTSESSAANKSSDASPTQKPSRPSMDRRISSAVDNIRDTIRTSLHPERWNWTRYEREDEVLGGINHRMSKMWDKMTGTKDEVEGRTWYGRRRAETNESERTEWNRGRNPEINPLHPPVVSQLPATRDEAGWMLLPPPSADVMAGRIRPSADANMRWPLAVVGRNRGSEFERRSRSRRNTADTKRRSRSSSRPGSKTPDLSTSSEETWSDEWDSEGERPVKPRRRSSAPLPGWNRLEAPTVATMKSLHDPPVELVVPVA